MFRCRFIDGLAAIDGFWFLGIFGATFEGAGGAFLTGLFWLLTVLPTEDLACALWPIFGWFRGMWLLLLIPLFPCTTVTTRRATCNVSWSGSSRRLGPVTQKETYCWTLVWYAIILYSLYLATQNRWRLWGFSLTLSVLVHHQFQPSLLQTCDPHQPSLLSLWKPPNCKTMVNVKQR